MHFGTVLYYGTKAIGSKSINGTLALPKLPEKVIVSLLKCQGIGTNKPSNSCCPIAERSYNEVLLYLIFSFPWNKVVKQGTKKKKRNDAPSNLFVFVFHIFIMITYPFFHFTDICGRKEFKVITKHQACSTFLQRFYKTTLVVCSV